MSEPSIEGPVGLVFPGQGSQFVGMATKLAETSSVARERLAEADEALGIPITAMMANGPADELEDTWNAQPAILAASVAAHAAVCESLKKRGASLNPVIGAGHSLGEFSALVAAGSIEYTDALKLVRERGRLMKEAGEAAPGGMAAILGVDDDKLAEICGEASSLGVIVIANANCPGQTVISGEVIALEKAMELAKAAGAKRALRLGVSIAAHSPLMAAANKSFGEAISAVSISDPLWPVISNSSVKPLSTADAVRAELLGHMEGPVLWTQTVQAMRAAGVSTLIELGPGNVLGGLIRRIDRDLAVKSIGDLGLELPVDAA